MISKDKFIYFTSTIIIFFLFFILHKDGNEESIPQVDGKIISRFEFLFGDKTKLDNQFVVQNGKSTRHSTYTWKKFLKFYSHNHCIFYHNIFKSK
jgi:hypothetical protein